MPCLILVRNYKTYEEISQALARQEVKGALVDLYVLSSHKHLFEDPRFRIVRVYEYKASYGVVLAGNSMKLDECFAEQIKSDAAHVFESIEENIKILRVGLSVSPFANIVVYENVLFSNDTGISMSVLLAQIFLELVVHLFCTS